MELVIPVDRFGRMILPQSVRKALGIKSAAAFTARITGNNTVELSLSAPKNDHVIKNQRGLLVVSTGGKRFNAADAVATTREERPPANTFTTGPR
jgi:bifunctional DNA-binding transcriptional regulator/antitoxin component of YhaV-PrlF toxin-antitoxin module